MLKVLEIFEETEKYLQFEIANIEKVNAFRLSRIDFDEIRLKGAISEVNQNKIFIPSFFRSPANAREKK